MKRSQFNEEQIIGILREAEAGSPVKAMCAPHNIGTATYHAWRRKFGGMEVSEAKRLRGLEEENSRLKRAESAEAATKRLSEFDAGPWGQKYPMIAESWRRNWEQIIPFYSYPPEVLKIIYTTNAIESLHMQLRKVLKNRRHFPSDEAATNRDVTIVYQQEGTTERLLQNIGASLGSDSTHLSERCEEYGALASGIYLQLLPRRYLELCVISQVANELKSGGVCSPLGDKFRDYCRRIRTVWTSITD